jgi:hypothetical protein
MIKLALAALNDHAALDADDCVVIDVARSFHDAAYLLDHSKYDVLFLNLGVMTQYGATLATGMDLLRWLFDRVKAERYIPPDIRLFQQERGIVPDGWADMICAKINEISKTEIKITVLPSPGRSKAQS